MDAFLKIRGLGKSFGTTAVLAGLDLDVQRGEILTIIGKSGMGKSVLLKCIANILTMDAGSIEVGGRPLNVQRASHAKADGLKFSYMFQNNALFDSLTAFENVALPLREGSRLAKAEIHERVEGILRQLDLANAAQRYPGDLSGGMNKRVAFARALVTKPELVLFDEPTTGLDPERKFGVFELIQRYQAQFDFTAILVSHDIPEVFEISDRVAWLDQGSIRFCGSVEALLKSEDSAVQALLQRSRLSSLSA